MENIIKISCRLCDEDIRNKNGYLLYDYNDNAETRIGRKLNIILHSNVSHHFFLFPPKVFLNSRLIE
mgnify:CR=1 FL=1